MLELTSGIIATHIYTIDDRAAFFTHSIRILCIRLISVFDKVVFFPHFTSFQ